MVRRSSGPMVAQSTVGATTDRAILSHLTRRETRQPEMENLARDAGRLVLTRVKSVLSP